MLVSFNTMLSLQSKSAVNEVIASHFGSVLRLPQSGKSQGVTEFF